MQAKAARLRSRVFGYDRPDGEDRLDLLPGCGPAALPTWADVFAARADWARRNREHLAACSCAMCGNPRKFWNLLTPQELRALDSAADPLEEMGQRVSDDMLSCASWTLLGARLPVFLIRFADRCRSLPQAHELVSPLFLALPP